MFDLILASPIIPTPVEARIFVALCCAYLVYDYRRDVKRSIDIKARKRAERQMFDQHNEVSSMIHKAVSTIRFSCMDFDHQVRIVRFINNRYK